MTIGEMIVKLGLDKGQFDSQLGAVEGQLRLVNKQVDQVAQGFQRFGANLSDVGAKMSMAVTLPLVGLGLAAVKVAGDFEQAKIAFTNMLGSAEQATSFLAQLRDFSLKTPFEFPGLVDASRRMLTFGFAAKDVVPMLTAVGNAVSAMGGSTEMLNRVTVALGQMHAKTKITADEMRQLTEAGIGGWQMLADKMGKSVAEVMKLSEKGLISAAEGIPAIIEGMNKRFGGMMEAQSHSLRGMWSNLKDQLTATLTSIGEALLPLGKQILGSLTPVLDFVAGLAKGFGELPGPLQTAILGFLALAAAIGPLTFATGQLVSAFGMLKGIVPTLTTGLGALATSSGTIKTVLLDLGKTAGVAAAAFYGWKLGEWLQKTFSSDYKRAESAIEALNEKLKAQGIIVERGGKSLKDYAAAVVAAYDKMRAEAAKPPPAPPIAPIVKSAEDQLKALQEAVNKAKANYELLWLGFEKGTVSVDRLRRAWTEYERAQRAADPTYAAKAFDQVAEDAERAREEVTKLWTEAYKVQAQWMQSNADLAKTMTKALWDMEAAALRQTKIEPATWLTLYPQNVKDAIAGIQEFQAALGRMGLAHTQTADQMIADYHTIVKQWGEAPEHARQVLVAEEKMLKAWIAEYQTAGEEIPKDIQKRLGQVEVLLGKHQEVWKQFAQSVSGIFQSAVDDWAGMLFGEKGSFFERLKAMFADIGKLAIMTFIQPVTKAIGDFIGGALADLMGGKGLGGLAARIKEVGDAFAGMFGGAGAATNVVRDAAGNVVSGGAGAGTGAAGAVTGGLTGAVTAIGTVVSAITDVLGYFQTRRMEKDIGSIEVTSRSSLNVLLDQLRTEREFLPWLKDLAEPIWGIYKYTWGTYDLFANYFAGKGVPAGAEGAPPPSAPAAAQPPETEATAPSAYTSPVAGVTAALTRVAAEVGASTSSLHAWANEQLALGRSQEEILADLRAQGWVSLDEYVTIAAQQKAAAARQLTAIEGGFKGITDLGYLFEVPYTIIGAGILNMTDAIEAERQRIDNLVRLAEEIRRNTEPQPVIEGVMRGITELGYLFEVPYTLISRGILNMTDAINAEKQRIDALVRLGEQIAHPSVPGAMMRETPVDVSAFSNPSLRLPILGPITVNVQGGSERDREFAQYVLNEFIRQAKENGQLL
jgi:tape measure domain-containing protein